MFVIPSVNSGGIETYLFRFLQEKKTEINATVLIRSNKEGDLLQEYKKLHFPLIFMPLSYYNPFRWLSFWKYLKSESFSTVCDFNANFAGITMIIAFYAKIDNRITFYRQGSDHFKPSIFKRTYNHLMNRLVYKYSSRILANSKAGEDFFFPYRKPDDNRFHILYNGITLNKIQRIKEKTELLRILDLPDHAFVIGHVGRVDKSKNHPTIFKVAAEIIKNNPDVFLVLCGNGTENLYNEAITYGISDNVCLLGFRSDVPSIMQIFDVFYFPSITEGQPNALLEAMVLGIPIVASDITPIKEIVPPGIHLFNPLDTQGAMAQIIKIKNGELAYNTSEQVEYVSAKFDAVNKFNEFLNILRNDE